MNVCGLTMSSRSNTCEYPNTRTLSPLPSLMTHPWHKQSLMIPPRHKLLRDPLIFHRRIDNHPLAQLAHLVPEYFLPRRLTLWHGIRSALRLALGMLLGRNLDVGGIFQQVDPDDIAVFEVAQHAARGCFRGGVEDGGGAAGAGLAAVADAWELGVSLHLEDGRKRRRGGCEGGGWGGQGAETGKLQGKQELRKREG